MPEFDVQLEPPDLRSWMSGHDGVPGFITRTGPEPGLHVALVALIHGNEIAGAIVLEKLLRSDLRPARGRLTMGFANLAAFQQFDPKQPTASRFVDEDMNRVWDHGLLDGPRRSNELDRARQIQPLIDTVDILLDLHTMLWPSEPLLLSGSSDKGRRLAMAIGTPPLVVADAGHNSGRRLIDYQRFTDPGETCTAVLVEAGQHWMPDTVRTTEACVGGLIRHLGLADPPSLPHPDEWASRPYFAEVTMVVTATTSAFSFVRAFQGGEVIPARNTLIAVDGATEIRTPHDNCLLIMPSLRPSRGHTAVRLARLAN